MASFETILINSISIAMLVFVIIYAWRQRAQTAALQLMAATFFMLLWAAGTFGELLAVSDTVKLQWRNFTQIGVFYAPAACLLFSFSYTGILSRLKKCLSIAIYAVQTFGIALIYTDPWLHLMRNRVDVVQSGASRVIVVESTTLASFLISINFVYLTASMVLLIVSAVRTRSGMRKQVVLTAIGMSIATSYAFLKVSSGEHFAPGVPISSVFGIVCLAMLLGILRYDFLKVLPLVRNEVFNIIDEGILVVSPRGMVLDVNEAAMRFVSRSLPELSRRDDRGFAAIGALLSKDYPDWYNAMLACRTGSFEISQTANNQTFHYSCSTYPLGSKRRRTLGAISVIRDITEQKIKNDLLKERAERDGLLGILNRQTFFECAENQLTAEGESSLAFFDIDDFKNVNDNYGHIAGDHVLREVCACVKRAIAPAALFGRIGGEEFAVFLEGGLEAAREACERIRVCVAEERIFYCGQQIFVTISIGIASGREHSLGPLHQRADRMLYRAKASGKNCIAS